MDVNPGRSSRCGSGTRSVAVSSRRSTSHRRRDRDLGDRARRRRACRSRSSSSRSGSRTTTARRRDAHSRSSRRCSEKPRGERAQPAERDSLPGEAEPAELSASQRAALERIVDALDAGESAQLPPLRRNGQRQDRGLPPGVRGCARTRPRRDRACPGDRAHAADARPLPRALRRAHRCAALGADGCGAARRARAHRERRGADRRRRALRGVRTSAAARRDLHRRGARRVLQAGVGPALRRAHRRGEARDARRRRRDLRQRDAAARELGTPRAARARRAARRPATARACRRPAPRSRLSAVRAATRRARSDRRTRRQGDPAAQPPRRCAGAALPRVRADAALRELRRRAGPARRPPAALPSLRSHRAEPETCPVCGSTELARLGAGTQRLERELEAKLPELERIRLDADTVEQPGALAAALQAFRATDRVVLVGTQMVAKGHHFPGVALAAVVDADTGLGLPDFRAEERTFQLLTQLAGRSGRDAPGRVLVQTFQPDSRAIELAARHDVSRFLDSELERRRELGYPPFRHLVRIVVTGPEPDAPLQALTRDQGRADGRPARARTAPPATRPLPRAARREDRSATPSRGAGRTAAQRGRAGDATRRPDGRGRRRSAEPLVPLPPTLAGFWPAITRRQSPPSPLARQTSLAAVECGLWLGARDPETQQRHRQGY